MKKGLKTWQKEAKGKTLNNANQNSIMEERTMYSPLVWQLPNAKHQVRRAAAGHPPQSSTARGGQFTLPPHAPSDSSFLWPGTALLAAPNTTEVGVF